MPGGSSTPAIARSTSEATEARSRPATFTITLATRRRPLWLISTAPSARRGVTTLPRLMPVGCAGPFTGSDSTSSRVRSTSSGNCTPTKYWLPDRESIQKLRLTLTLEFMATTTCRTTSSAERPSSAALVRSTSSTRYGASARWWTRTSAVPATGATRSRTSRAASSDCAAVPPSSSMSIGLDAPMFRAVEIMPPVSKSARRSAKAGSSAKRRRSSDAHSCALRVRPRESCSRITASCCPELVV